MHRNKVIAVVAAGAAIVALAACSSSKKSGSSDSGGSSSSAAASGNQPKSKVVASQMTGDCAPFSAYGSHPGTTVTMYASITDPEGGYLQQSWKQFEKCTGITIAYTGDKEFESALKTKVEGGNAPDIAIIPQPGLLQTYAEAGKLKPASDALTKEAKANWNKDWISYGTDSGIFFAAPMGANAKSLGLVLAEGVRRQGLHRPDDLGRHGQAVEQDRRRRRQAMVCRYRVGYGDRLDRDRLA